jgi:hypothetical protein
VWYKGRVEFEFSLGGISAAGLSCDWEGGLLLKCGLDEPREIFP